MLSNHPNLRRYRNSVRKDMHAVPLHEAQRIHKIHHTLANAGVPVPKTLLDISTRALCMPYLCDTTAYQFLTQNSCSTSKTARWSILFNSEISPLIPLVKLYAVPANNASVSFSQPWKSVQNRLVRISSQRDEYDTNQYPVPLSRLQACYSKLSESEIRYDCLQSEKHYLVHGDFHLKQVLIDQKKNFAWLIDLDDVCVGHIEQDIGNMLAHLLTSEEFWQSSLEDHHGWLTEIVVASLNQLCDMELNKQRLAFYTALALLRRALKFVSDERYMRHRSMLTDSYFDFVEKLTQNSDNLSINSRGDLLILRRM